MPRVPQLDNVSVLPGVRPTPQARLLDAPELRDFGSRQLLAQSEALGRAGSVATGIAADMQAQANKVRLDDAQNRLMAVETDLRIKTSALKGRNALERPDGKALPDEMGEEFDKAVREIEDGLGNDYQRQAFRSSASQIGARFRGAVAQHMVGEQRTFEVETAKSGIAVEVDRAIKLAGDKLARQESLAAVDGHLASLARAQGWDANTLAEARLESRSKVHSGLIATMIGSGRSQDAKAYYEANSAEMTVQARTTMLPKLQEANDTQVGQAKAASAWREHGPKGPNEAARIADIEKSLREDPDLKNNPAALNVALSTAREEFRAHNAQQTEVNAQFEAGVWQQYNQGARLSQIRNSDAWRALSPTRQAEIIRRIEADDATRASRAAADENRRLAAANRGLIEDERRLRSARVARDLMFEQNIDKYLSLTNPEVLASIKSRGQIEAMQTLFGPERTLAVLGRWDELQKPGKLNEMRVDAQEFNVFAQQAGLRPNDPSKSEAEKNLLAQAHERVEQVLAARQKQVGRNLTQDEKREVMRGEIARTVTVDTWGPNNKQVPVIALSEDQVGNVMVPAADRAKIIEALKAEGRPVSDPEIRRIYIRRMSPAAAPMVPNER